MKRKLFILGLITFLTYSCSTDESEIQQVKNSTAKINNQEDFKDLANETKIDSHTFSLVKLSSRNGEPSNPIPPRN